MESCPASEAAVGVLTLQNWCQGEKRTEMAGCHNEASLQQPLRYNQRKIFHTMEDFFFQLFKTMITAGLKNCEL